MLRLSQIVALFGLLVVSACAPATAPTGTPEGERPASAGPKVLTIATLVPMPGFGPWDIGTTQGGWAALVEIASTGLVVDAATGGLEPRLATRMPSLDDGSVALLPDGRMQVTWRLREGVRWHDGSPFTGEDLAMSVQMGQHPELARGSTAAVMARIERLDVTDPHTVVITWKSIFVGAVAMDLRTLWPYPAHLLRGPLEGDKTLFQANPYFTTQYVGLGPFRLVDFGLGDQQVFERYDGYFLGRPKLDRIVIRAIPDANAIYVNIKAGSVDMASEQTMPLSLYLQLRDEWKATGEGSVVQRQGIWRYLHTQLRPEFARWPELPQDVSLRRGLLMAIDRDALRETTLPGVANTSADTFMAPTDPRATTVGRPFAPFPYDPRRALTELANGGWKPDAEGRMVNAAGERVDIPIRTSGQYVQETSIIADYWRKLGFAVSEEVASPAQSQDSEYKAKFPGLDVTGRSFNEGVLQYFDSRLIAGPQNRWSGSNVPGYTNPALDRLIDQIQQTFDSQQQAQLLRQAGEILATDLPIMPTYFAVWLAAVRKSTLALRDDYAATIQSAGASRNAHLWDLACPCSLPTTLRRKGTGGPTIGLARVRSTSCTPARERRPASISAGSGSRFTDLRTSHPAAPCRCAS